MPIVLQLSFDITLNLRIVSAKPIQMVHQQGYINSFFSIVSESTQKIRAIHRKLVAGSSAQKMVTWEKVSFNENIARFIIERLPKLNLANVFSQLYADFALHLKGNMVMLLLIIVMEMQCKCKKAQKNYKLQIFLVFSRLYLQNSARQSTYD